jgi:hypothetical protein
MSREDDLTCSDILFFLLIIAVAAAIVISIAWISL